jgi:hypothetical protein
MRAEAIVEPQAKFQKSLAARIFCEKQNDSSVPERRA